MWIAAPFGLAMTGSLDCPALKAVSPRPMLYLGIKAGLPSGSLEGGAYLGLFGKRFIEAGEIVMDQRDFGLGRVRRGLALFDCSSAEIIFIMVRHHSSPW